MNKFNHILKYVALVDLKSQVSTEMYD